MSNIALIIAGGIGVRMHQPIPKQFIPVNGKPIIIYTLEKFVSHKSIDGIVVVCVNDWIYKLNKLIEDCNFDKPIYTVQGGSVGQESILKGLIEVKTRFGSDVIVLIHDAIRPLVSDEIISDCIKTVKIKGNAIASINCQEAMLETADKISSNSSYPRDKLMRTQTPQGFFLNDILNVHEQARKLGISNSIASCTLFIETGHEVFFSLGSEKNIKITTPEDLEIFQMFLNFKAGQTDGK